MPDVEPLGKRRWPTCKAAGVVCAGCGKSGTCTVAPDGTAFKCWRDGGKVLQTGSPKVAGTGYTGKAHRPKPIAPKQGTYQNAESAIKAAGRAIPDAKLAAVWTYIAGGSERLKVARFDLPGKKEFRPVHPNCQGWKIGDPPGQLPLYRLDERRPNSATSISRSSARPRGRATRTSSSSAWPGGFSPWPRARCRSGHGSGRWNWPATPISG